MNLCNSSAWTWRHCCNYHRRRDTSSSRERLSHLDTGKLLTSDITIYFDCSMNRGMPLSSSCYPSKSCFLQCTCTELSRTGVFLPRSQGRMALGTVDRMFHTTIEGYRSFCFFCFCYCHSSAPSPTLLLLGSFLRFNSLLPSLLRSGSTEAFLLFFGLVVLCRP